MSTIFKPGQKVYLLFWRRKEEFELTRVQIFTSKRRRDNANVETLSWGLITLTAEWEIPTPVNGNLKEVKLTPNCPKCGSTMERLHYGEGNDEWVCPNHCDSTLDEVLNRAEKLASQILDDDEQYV